MSLDLAIKVAQQRLQMNHNLGYRYEPIYIVHTQTGYEAFSREAAAAFPMSSIAAIVDAEIQENVNV